MTFRWSWRGGSVLMVFSDAGVSNAGGAGNEGAKASGRRFNCRLTGRSRPLMNSGIDMSAKTKVG
ncbi:protein of unknown function [Paraburkholderia dioscoreae]|uniref:Uncharacterized protein n=1 Tax=Paraburkholderia dioscoreae TaxID=2604047 RepID=A0A5Q4ZPR2_9BURK|nr:protein of unknown function [Paraburkholderia dioscoreae]